MRSSVREYLLQRGKLNPVRVENFAAWYDSFDRDSLFLNSSDKAVLIGDKSGNSGAGTGTDRFLYLNGASGTYASAPDSAALNAVTGDFTIKGYIKPAVIVSGAVQSIFSKRGAAGTAALTQWQFRLDADGKPRLVVSDGVSTAFGGVSTVVLPSSAVQMKVTFDADNGAGGCTTRFYYATNEGEPTWVLLDTVVYGAVCVIAPIANALTIGSLDAGTSQGFTGQIRNITFQNGIDGTIVFDADFASQGPGTAAFKESSSNQATVTFNGNAKITYVDAGNCLVLPGVASNYASAPDSTALDLSTGFDFIVKAAADDWTPATQSNFLGKLTVSGNQRSYRFILATSGKLILDVSEDGITEIPLTSSVATGLTGGSDKWLRATGSISAGTITVRFYLGDDGASWTQLGTEQTASITSIYNSSATLNIGAVNVGATERFIGKIYRAIIKDAPDGTTVFDADFSTVPKLATSFTESSSNAATVTINSTAIALPARIHGERDLYMGTAASQPVYLRHDGTNYGYLNGASGVYFSTPNSLDTTTSQEMVACVALADYTPATNNAILGKRNVTNAVLFRINTAGTITIASSPWGGTSTATLASVGITDGQKVWLKASRDATSGDIKFYHGTDGTNWTQLGDTVSSATGAGTSNADTWNVGSYQAGASELASGKIYYVSFATSVSGTPLTSNATPALVFNASDYPLTGGSTFTSSATGETWTINGGALIVDRTGLLFDGSADYFKSASFPLSQPENVYFVGRQVTWTQGEPLMDGNSASESMKIGQGYASAGSTSPTLSLYSGTDAAENSGLAVKKSGVITAQFNGASSSLRINRGSAVVGNAGTQNAGGIQVGSRITSGTYGNVFVHEILIYDTTAHSTYQQDRLIMSRGRKWRVSTTP